MNLSYTNVFHVLNPLNHWQPEFYLNTSQSRPAPSPVFSSHMWLMAAWLMGCIPPSFWSFSGVRCLRYTLQCYVRAGDCPSQELIVILPYLLCFYGKFPFGADGWFVVVHKRLIYHHLGYLFLMLCYHSFHGKEFLIMCMAGSNRGHMHLSVGAHRGHRRAPDPRSWNYRWLRATWCGCRNQTQVLCKAVSILNDWASLQPREHLLLWKQLLLS